MAALNVAEGVREGSHVIEGPDKHLYHFNREMAGGRISLRCSFSKRRGFHCRGRASVDKSGKMFKCTQPHNHPRLSHFFQAKKFRCEVLKRCRNADWTPLRIIYNQERRKFRSDVARAVCATIPYHALRPAMQRARAKCLPPIPRTIPELAKILSSPEHHHLTGTLDGEDSVFAASGGDESEGTAFVVLASRRMLQCLSRARKIFADGTFCTPAALKCRQIWNIVTLRRHHIVPVARVIMQSKSQKAYELVLQKLNELCPRFNPLEVMCDFESAQERAMRTQFPNAMIHGCLFHSTKAIGKKARKLKLVPLIRRNHSANSIVRSLCAIALLPSNDIPKALCKLARRARRERMWIPLLKLFSYFKSYWLPRKSILSVYGCDDRTNNACESDNRTFRDAVKVKHPNIFCFLNGVLELEDESYQNVLVLDQADAEPSRGRRASVLNNDMRIKRLMNDLKSHQICTTDFLRRASRQVQTAFNRGLNVDDDFS